MEQYSTNNQWFSDVMFLSRNAYWSGPVILILCVIIALVAFYRRATVLAALFSFLFIAIFTLPNIGRSLTSDLSSAVMLAMQHASQLLRIFPYLLILWMLIKKNNHESDSKQ